MQNKPLCKNVGKIKSIQMMTKYFLLFLTRSLIILFSLHEKCHNLLSEMSDVQFAPLFYTHSPSTAS